MTQLIPIASALASASGAMSSFESLGNAAINDQQRTVRNNLNALQRSQEQDKLANDAARTLASARARLVGQGLLPVEGTSSKVYLQAIQRRFQESADNLSTEHNLETQNEELESLQSSQRLVSSALGIGRTLNATINT